METLGQLGAKMYVADPDTDVLFVVVDGVAAPVIGIPPESFLKFSGAYLEPAVDPAAAIAAVERTIADEPPPLPRRGTPPSPGSPAFVVGEMADGTRILSASGDRATDTTEVWLESDLQLVTTMGDVNAYRDAVWDDTPATV